MCSDRGVSGSDIEVEDQRLGLGHVAEGPLDVVDQVADDVPDVDDDRAGLDLREIEDVVDEAEQIVAGGVDGARELHLLAGQVPFGVARELIRDRMSRLFSGVRSSCDMLARNSDLYLEVSASCVAFSSSACRACSTSRVLALHFRVLVRQQLRLLLELHVGLLQLLLPALELFGERLGLLEQILGQGVRLDRVETRCRSIRPADRGTPGASALKLLEGGELHDRLHLPSNSTGRR